MATSVRAHHNRRPSKLDVEPSGVILAPEPGDAAPKQSDGGWTPEDTDGDLDVIPENRPRTLEANAEPEKQTIKPAPSRSLIARLVRKLRRLRQDWPDMLTALLATPKLYARAVWMMYAPEDKLLPEELMRRREIERRRKMEKLLVTEGQLYWDRLQGALDRHGHMHRTTKEDGGGMRVTKHVEFSDVKMLPEALWYRIDTSRLPFGVSINDLVRNEALLVDLSISCGRRISTRFSEDKGAWFIVERAVGVRGIPDHVRLDEMIAGMPASSDGLTIVMGMAINSKPVYRSLGRMYNMLIGGTTGAGKSNFVNVLLTTLIRRNTPDRLKLVLVDLKGGLEFQFYEGIPHLIPVPDVAPNGIADQNTQVPGVLNFIHREGERRMDVLREAGYKSIGRYNAHARGGRRLPHIVLVIDEWADVMYMPALKRECEELLANIAQRFRAVGIHVILCTQIPKAEVISTRIKGVLPAKVAFGVPSIPASMVMIDNADAKGLTPSGRYIFQWEGQYEIQAPFINEEQINEIVQSAIKGETIVTDRSHDVTQLELLEWALAHDNGYLTRDTVHAQFSKRGLARAELDTWLAELEGQQIVIGTSLYKIEKAKGARPRRLVPIDEDADDIPDDQQTNEP
jgi:hypothetical protein